MARERRLGTLTALSLVAVLGWAIVAALVWRQAEEGHDHRRQVRLLMMAEGAVRAERDHLRQAAGNLADLQAKSSAALQELVAATEARARLAGQLQELERTIEAQVRRTSELARTGDDLFQQVLQLQGKSAEATNEFRQKLSELTRLEDDIGAETQALAAVVREVREQRAAAALVTRSIADRRSEETALEQRLQVLRAELDETKRRGIAPDLLPAPLDPELRTQQ